MSDANIEGNFKINMKVKNSIMNTHNNRKEDVAQKEKVSLTALIKNSTMDEISRLHNE
jgi:hypothetical protein